MPNSGTRLNRRLVELGLAASRRKADELIVSGMVKVNNIATTELVTFVEPTDIVTVNGKSGQVRDDILLRFHKPVGYISSHTRQGSAPTIFQLLPRAFHQLKIVGRLDRESEGLMLLTSSGDFVQKYSHPRNHVDKEYVVQVDRTIDNQLLNLLKQPVKIDGKPAQFDDIKRIDQYNIKVLLSEGRNRQIRRMLAQNGLEVVRLQRTRIGQYQLDRLPVGHYEFAKLELP